MTRVNKVNLVRKVHPVLRVVRVLLVHLVLPELKVTRARVAFLDPLAEMVFPDSEVYLGHLVQWDLLERTVTRANLVNPVKRVSKEEKEMLVHPDLPESQEFEVNPDLWDHLARRDPPVTLDVAVPRVKTDLRVSVVLLDPRATRVFLDLLVSRERKVILDPRVPLDPLVNPVNRDLLVRRVFRVSLAQLDPKVLKDPKVKLATLDHLDLLDKMVFMANEDNPDLKVKKANPVFRVRLVLVDPLDLKDLREVLATLDSLDPTVNPENKVPKVTAAKTALTVDPVKLDHLAKLDHQAKWDFPALPVNLELRVPLVSKAARVYLVTKVTRAPVAYLDPLEHLVNKVCPDHKDLPDFEDLLDLRVMLDLLVNLVRLATLAATANLVCAVRRVNAAVVDPRATEVNSELLVARVKSVKRVNLVREVCKDLRDPRANPDPSDPWA